MPLEELQLNSSPQEPAAAPQPTDAVPKKPRSSRKRRSPAQPADPDDQPSKALAADQNNAKNSRAARKSHREARQAEALAAAMPSSHAEDDSRAPAAFQEPMGPGGGNCTQPAERPEGRASEVQSSKLSLDLPGKLDKVSNALSLPPAPRQHAAFVSGSGPAADVAIQPATVTEQPSIPSVAALAAASPAEDATSCPATGIEAGPTKGGHHSDAVKHQAKSPEELAKAVDAFAAAHEIAPAHTFPADAACLLQACRRRAEEPESPAAAPGIPCPDSFAPSAYVAQAPDIEMAHQKPLQLRSIKEKPGTGPSMPTDVKQAESAAADGPLRETPWSCCPQNGPDSGSQLASITQLGFKPSQVDISLTAAAAAAAEIYPAALSARQTQDQVSIGQQQQHDMRQEHCMMHSNQGAAAAAAAEQDLPHDELTRREPRRVGAESGTEHCMASKQGTAAAAAGEDAPRKTASKGPECCKVQPSSDPGLAPSGLWTEAAAHHHGPVIERQEPITAQRAAGPNTEAIGKTRAAAAAAKEDNGNAASVLAQDIQELSQNQPQDQIGGSAGEFAGQDAGPASPSCKLLVMDCTGSPEAESLDQRRCSEAAEGVQRRSSRSGAGKRSQPCFEDDVIASPPKRKRVSGAGKGNIFLLYVACNDRASTISYTGC